MDTNSKNDSKINDVSEVNGNEINNMKESNNNKINGTNKSKDNNTGEKKTNTFALTMAIISIILLLAIASVSSYMPIRDYVFNTNKNIENYLQSEDFIHRLSSLTEYLYKAKIKGEEWYFHDYENLRSIKYHIGSSDNSINITNIPEFTTGKLADEILDSQFDLRTKIHKNGEVEVVTSLGDRFNTRLFINSLNLETETNEEVSLPDEFSVDTEETSEIIENEEENVDEVSVDTEETSEIIENEEENIDEVKEELEELEIIYIIPKDIEKYNDAFVQNIKYHYVFPEYIILIFVIGVIGILLLTLIAFGIPYTHQKRCIISRIYNKMFIELKLLIWFTFITLSTGIFILINPYDGWRGLEMVNIIYDVNKYFYLIGIPITFVLYGLIYLTIVYIKYIYYNGFKKGFIQNSFTARIGFSIIRGLKRTLTQFMALDISRDPNRSIFILLVINLFILWMTLATGGMGFILGVFWAIFMFKYLVNFMINLKQIHDVSTQLSQGDFNINLDEEMGILTPISQNLNNIKEGFRLAVDREIKSERMKSELISNVSHDLKTPLTSIITYIDLLKDENLDLEEQKRYIDILDKKAKRLDILIEDLFDASKASSGNIELDLEEIDIVALFRQTLGEMEEKLNATDLIMRMNIPDKKIICKLDGRRTYRIFENIMENILKYAMENTRVYIDILEEEREVRFIFKNISSYEMNFDPHEITERFIRGDKSRNTEGSGLGLSIAKSLVELQNGKMDISIDGDLFKLTLTFLKD